MQTIRALRNDIVFSFIDQVDSRGFFKQKIRGFVVAGDHEDSAGTSRWARIISLGPDVCETLKQPGCEILIENLRWTQGVKVGDRTIWKTDDSQVLGYRIVESSEVS